MQHSFFKAALAAGLLAGAALATAAPVTTDYVGTVTGESGSFVGDIGDTIDISLTLDTAALAATGGVDNFGPTNGFEAEIATPSTWLNLAYSVNGVSYSAADVVGPNSYLYEIDDFAPAYASNFGLTSVFAVGQQIGSPAAAFSATFYIENTTDGSSYTADGSVPSAVGTDNFGQISTGSGFLSYSFGAAVAPTGVPAPFSLGLLGFGVALAARGRRRLSALA